MSIIEVSTTASRLEQVIAGIEGVLCLLEQQCERSEQCFSAYCLLGLVRAQLELVLAEELPVH